MGDLQIAQERPRWTPRDPKVLPNGPKATSRNIRESPVDSRRPLELLEGPPGDVRRLPAALP